MIRNNRAYGTLLKGIFPVFLASVLLLINRDIEAQVNQEKIPLDNLEQIILELKYIETPTGLASSVYRLTPEYNLSIGPGDFNRFYNHVDGLAEELYFPRDSVVTGLFGLAPLTREEKDKFMLWSPDSLMLFTLLRDLRGWELVLNIFALWRFDSDSLRLECLCDSTLVSGLGYASLKNIYRIDSTAYIITGETSGGDEGVFNGSVWFGYWQIPCEYRIFYRSRYRTSLCEKEQKLDYRIDESSLTAVIIKQERKVLDCDEDLFRNTEFTDWFIVEVDSLDLYKMISEIK